jgi:predicted nuclease with TOPRIM domain
LIYLSKGYRLVVDNTALATELGLVKANLHDVQATCAEKELTRTAELQEELEEARNAASENDHKYKTVLSQLQNQEKELSQAKDAQAIAEGELSALKVCQNRWSEFLDG